MSAQGSLATTLALVLLASGLVLCRESAEGHVRWPDDVADPTDVAAIHDSVIFCGQMDENGTIYFAPGVLVHGGTGSDLSLSSGGCDANDGAEAAVKAALFAELTFRFTGMWCEFAGTLETLETATFTMRADEVTVTAGSEDFECRMTNQNECSFRGTSGIIAAGQKLAMRAVQTSNNGDTDDGWCRAYMSVL